MIEKSKHQISKPNTTASDRKRNQYDLVTSLVDALNERDDFEIDHKKSFKVEETKVSKTPITTEINEVVVNKLKITQAQEIVFKDQDQRSISAKGEINYEGKEALEHLESGPYPQAYIQDVRRVEAERLTYFKKSIREQNKYFFKVKNHDEFYQMGRSFHEDYKAGQKFFLFSHLAAGFEQQQSILGVASFLQYFDKVNVLIISSNLDQDFFKGILQNVEGEKLRITPKETNTGYFLFHEGMTFLDANSIKTKNAGDLLNYEQVISNLHNLFDCILYDLPDVMGNKPYLDFYFPIYKTADSVSLVFAKNSSTFKGVSEVIHHFNSYNVRIKGALMAQGPGVKSER